MRFRLPQCWPRLLLYGPPALVVAAFLAHLWGAFHMPGPRHRGPLPPLREAQRELSRELGAIIVRLAADIGERRVGRPEKLAEARAYIEAEFGRAGYLPRRQEFSVRGIRCANVEATLSGSDRAHEVIVFGAHYDSAPGTPGADDNASGVAALLALARQGVGMRPRRTVRFVAFVNEEPPFFRTENMGSVRYAREATGRGERIVMMLSLESLGYYSDRRGSQQYPFPLGWFYPTTGDFVAFVGRSDSRALVRRATGAFRRHAAFPALGAAIPGAGMGADLSDHWAFSDIGVPALMVTDTAMLRNPHYHQSADTAEAVDFERLSRVVDGLRQVLADLANGESL